MQRFQFDRFLVQQLLSAVFGANNELSVWLGEILGVGLAFENDLNVHLRAEFLIGHVNGNLVPPDFAEEAKELAPEAIELTRIGILGQAPAPESLDGQHSR